ncbi:MAG: alpha/beta hydrolase [Deltaproteobacteria bacterium]|jgi:pimeloyl-ACP methyl ester carboxylesterase|nr:alpha/beta hydrolase [Deltaproteobacteria bacterium]
MTSAENLKVPECPPLKIAETKVGNISYREKGNGKTLLFLHGNLGNSRSWAFQLEDFSRSYRVVAWDAPGYGRSDEQAVNIDAYAEALAAFLDKVGGTPVALVGHSMGGAVGARFAALYPGKITSLVLSCSHPGYAEPATAPMSEKFEKRMEELKRTGKEAYGLARARDLLPGVDETRPEFLYAAEIAAETQPEGLRRASRMLQLADNRPLTPKLKGPILILTGGIDKVVAPRLKADLLASVPYTQHIEMPGLAHAPYFQAPEYYNNLIRDFLSGNLEQNGRKP